MIRHAKGWFKDKVDNRDLKTVHLIGAIEEQSQALNVPNWGEEYPEVDLTQYVHEMWNQGEQNACVGFALARISHMRGLIQGHEDMDAPSPWAIWSLARMYEKSLVTPLTNVGVQPRNACKMASLWGLAPVEAWNPNPSNLNMAPTPDVLAVASKYRMASYYAIDDTDRLTTVRRALTAGVPVAAAILADRTFEEYTGSHVMTELDGSNYGNHYVSIIGYNDDAFLICNSWGDTWGFGGFAWISPTRLADPSTQDLRAALVIPCIEAP